MLACLEKARAVVGPVFVLQYDEQTGEADDLMLADLDDMGIETALVALNDGGPVDRRLEDVKIALFGFEAVSLNGEIAHRNGLQAVLRPIEAFLTVGRRRRTGITVCGVGESWKVREFDTLRSTDQKKKVPTRLLYRTQTEFFIVTDCVGPDKDHPKPYHEPTGTGPARRFDLVCCRDAWTALRSAVDDGGGASGSPR